MRIVADENIPMIREALEGLGEVRLAAGRSLRSEDVRDADALLVRSVTRVDADLLGGSSVRFVGTATIGVDHVDQAWLESSGIAFASAQGSNAESVVQYVMAAICELAVRGGFSLQGCTLGIVGCGAIGGRLRRRIPELGMRVLANDPPLERAGSPGPWASLDTVLAESDIVTFHVPLNREGPDRTVGLAGEAQLARMKPGAFLINSSRGPVVDNRALRDALASGRIGGAVLDVWEGEPAIVPGLLDRIAIATPHIAGYSLDGKVNGTRMMAEALARFSGTECKWQPRLPPPEQPSIALLPYTGFDEALGSAVLHTYPIADDDRLMRDGADLGREEWAKHFDSLRKTYRIRREFPAYEVHAVDCAADAQQALKALGFRLE